MTRSVVTAYLMSACGAGVLDGERHGYNRLVQPESIRQIKI